MPFFMSHKSVAAFLEFKVAGYTIDSLGRRWDPSLHPRDARGRFIETGGVVRVGLGGLGTVKRAMVGGKVEVEMHADGSHRVVPSQQVTMVRRPDGTKPTASVNKVAAEDARREADPSRGDGKFAVDPGDDKPFTGVENDVLAKPDLADDDYERDNPDDGDEDDEDGRNAPEAYTPTRENGQEGDLIAVTRKGKNGTPVHVLGRIDAMGEDGRPQQVTLAGDKKRRLDLSKFEADDYTVIPFEDLADPAALLADAVDSDGEPSRMDNELATDLVEGHSKINRIRPPAKPRPKGAEGGGVIERPAIADTDLRYARVGTKEQANGIYYNDKLVGTIEKIPHRDPKKAAEGENMFVVTDAHGRRKSKNVRISRPATDSDTALEQLARLLNDPDPEKVEKPAPAPQAAPQADVVPEAAPKAPAAPQAPDAVEAATKKAAAKQPKALSRIETNSGPANKSRSGNLVAKTSGANNWSAYRKVEGPAPTRDQVLSGDYLAEMGPSADGTSRPVAHYKKVSALPGGLKEFREQWVGSDRDTVEAPQAPAAPEQVAPQTPAAPEVPEAVVPDTPAAPAAPDANDQYRHMDALTRGQRDSLNKLDDDRLAVYNRHRDEGVGHDRARSYALAPWAVDKEREREQQAAPAAPAAPEADTATIAPEAIDKTPVSDLSREDLETIAMTDGLADVGRRNAAFDELEERDKRKTVAAAEKREQVNATIPDEAPETGSRAPEAAEAPEAPKAKAPKAAKPAKAEKPLPVTRVGAPEAFGLTKGARVETEFGDGTIANATNRSVTVKLDNGDTINVQTHTPGYGRINPTDRPAPAKAAERPSETPETTYPETTTESTTEGATPDAVRVPDSPVLGDVPAQRGGEDERDGQGAVLPVAGEGRRGGDRGRDNGEPRSSAPAGRQPRDGGEASGERGSAGTRGSADGDGVPAEGARDGDAGARSTAADVDAAQRGVTGKAFRPSSQADLAGGDRIKDKDRARDNLNALKTLRKIQEEGRTEATADEQAAMAKWGGMGAIKPLFTKAADKDWKALQDEFRALVPDAKEWEGLKDNSANAHYTDYAIVDSMWSALEGLGLSGGNVLEPGSGLGNFIFRAPSGAKVHGVEVEPITAAIAQLLSPDADIRNEDFGRTRAVKGAFDAVIGNVPFGNYPVYDSEFNPKLTKRIHDHFIEKSLASVKPGGVMAMVTSAGTLDKGSRESREAIYKNADLIGAVRLPNGAHKDAAGTDVATDVLLFRVRKPGETPGDDSWLTASVRTHPDGTLVVGSRKDSDGNRLPQAMNDYFLDNPDHVLGDVVDGGFNHIEVQGEFDPEELKQTLENIVERAKTDGRDFTMDAPTDGDLFHESAKRLVPSTIAPERPKDGIGENLLPEPSQETLARLGARLQGSIAHVGTWDRKRAKTVAAGGSKAGKVKVTQEHQFAIIDSFGNEVPHEPSQGERDELARLLRMRDLREDLIALEKSEEADTTPQMDRLRKELSDAYDDYAATYGPIGRVKSSYRKMPADQAAKYQAKLDAGESPDPDIRATADGFYERVSRTYPSMGGMRNDPSFWSLLSLEGEYDEGSPEDPTDWGTATRGDVLSNRQMRPYQAPETADTADDALNLVRERTGKIDLDEVARVLGLEGGANAALAVLGNRVVKDPRTGEYVPYRRYISSINLREELRALQVAVQEDPSLQRNIDMVIAATPEDKKLANITARLGSGWIPEHYFQDFLRETIGGAAGQRVTLSKEKDEDTGKNKWSVKGRDFGDGSIIGGPGAPDNRPMEQRRPGSPDFVPLVAKWGTSRKTLQDLVAHALNQSIPEVKDKQTDAYGNEREVLNREETDAAKDMLETVQNQFSIWLRSDPSRAEALERIYNDRFRSRVPANYIDSPARAMPGMSDAITLDQHQIDGITRGVEEDAMGAAWEVGVGKTFLAAGLYAERLRLGKSKKIYHTTPNHLVEQSAREFKHLYPDMKVLVVDGESMKSANQKGLDSDAIRRRTMSQMRDGDWDVVIVSESADSRIVPNVELLVADKEAQLEKKRAERERAEERGDTVKFNQITQQIKKIEADIEQMRGQLEGDGANRMDFDSLGFDYIGVDESHRYKNDLVIGGPPGFSGAASARAQNLRAKIDGVRAYNQSIGRDHGVLLLSGTPVTNNTREFFVNMRMLRPDLLEEAGVLDFDDFYSQFLESAEDIEGTVYGGTQVKVRDGFRLVNAGELVRMWQSTWDVAKASDVGIERPTLKGGAMEQVVVPMTDNQDAYYKHLWQRYQDRPRKWKLEKGDDNALAIGNDGLLAAIDMRLLPDHELAAIGLSRDELTDDDGKVGPLARAVIDQWKATKDTVYQVRKGVDKNGNRYPDHENPGALQLIFSDVGVPGGSSQSGFNLYEAIKNRLIADGMAPDEVAFIHDAADKATMKKLTDAARAGKIKVLIGSSAKMATGLNVQDRLTNVWHIDTQKTPDVIEQRNGRAIRRGNQNAEVGIGYITTEGTSEAWAWSVAANKDNFLREFDEADMDATVVGAPEDNNAAPLAQLKATAANDPYMMEMFKAKKDAKDIERIAAMHQGQIEGASATLTRAQAKIDAFDGTLATFDKALESWTEITSGDNNNFLLRIAGPEGGAFNKFDAAAPAFEAAVRAQMTRDVWADQTPWTSFGSLGGQDLIMRRVMTFDGKKHIEVGLNTPGTYTPTPLPGSPIKVDPSAKFDSQSVVRLRNLVNKLPSLREDVVKDKSDQESALGQARETLASPEFARQAELDAARKRVETLDALSRSQIVSAEGAPATGGTPEERAALKARLEADYNAAKSTYEGIRDEWVAANGGVKAAAKLGAEKRSRRDAQAQQAERLNTAIVESGVPLERAPRKTRSAADEDAARTPGRARPFQNTNRRPAPSRPQRAAATPTEGDEQVTGNMADVEQAPGLDDLVDPASLVVSDKDDLDARVEEVRDALADANRRADNGDDDAISEAVGLRDELNELEAERDAVEAAESAPEAPAAPVAADEDEEQVSIAPDALEQAPGLDDAGAGDEPPADVPAPPADEEPSSDLPNFGDKVQLADGRVVTWDADDFAGMTAFDQNGERISLSVDEVIGWKPADPTNLAGDDTLTGTDDVERVTPTRTPRAPRATEPAAAADDADQDAATFTDVESTPDAPTIMDGIREEEAEQAATDTDEGDEGGEQVTVTPDDMPSTDGLIADTDDDAIADAADYLDTPEDAPEATPADEVEDVVETTDVPEPAVAEAEQVVNDPTASEEEVASAANFLDQEPETVEPEQGEEPAIAFVPEGPAAPVADAPRVPEKPQAAPAPTDYEPRTPTQLEDEDYPLNAYQQVIADDVVVDNVDVVAAAKAGTGKTSTAVGIAKRMLLLHPKRRGGYLAFNKSVKLEATRRMPKNVEALTGHGAPWRWIGSEYTDARFEKGLIVSGEVADFLGIPDGEMTDIGDRERQAWLVTNAVSRYSFSADDDLGLQHFSTPDGENLIEGASDADKARLLGWAQKAWADISNREGGKLWVDNDHIRKQWALARPDFSKPGWGFKRKIDFVFLDEAQDTPPVLAKVLNDQSIQKIILGDADQAIYGSFTGSVNYMSTIVPNPDRELRERPLPESYRYGANIADAGNRALQIEGSTERVIGSGSTPGEIISGEQRMANPDAILVRSNGGMLGEALAYIEGLDNGEDDLPVIGVPKGTAGNLKSLIASVRFLRDGGSRPRTMHEDLARYAKWDQLVAAADDGTDARAASLLRLLEKHNLGTMEGIVANMTELRTAGDGIGEHLNLQKINLSPVPDDPNLIWIEGDFLLSRELRAAGYTSTKDYLYQQGVRGGKFGDIPGADPHPEGSKKAGQPRQGFMFPKEKADEIAKALRSYYDEPEPVEPDVVISTVHKAKGLEWDNVRIGDDFMQPRTSTDEEGRETTVFPDGEEMRIAYVAFTRAAKKLDVGSLGWVYHYSDPNGSGERRDRTTAPETRQPTAADFDASGRALVLDPRVDDELPTASDEDDDDEVTVSADDLPRAPGVDTPADEDEDRSLDGVPVASEREESDDDTRRNDRDETNAPEADDASDGAVVPPYVPTGEDDEDDTPERPVAGETPDEAEARRKRNRDRRKRYDPNPSASPEADAPFGGAPTPVAGATVPDLPVYGDPDPSAGGATDGASEAVADEDLTLPDGRRLGDMSVEDLGAALNDNMRDMRAAMNAGDMDEASRLGDLGDAMYRVAERRREDSVLSQVERAREPEAGPNGGEMVRAGDLQPGHGVHFEGREWSVDRADTFGNSTTVTLIPADATGVPIGNVKRWSADQQVEKIDLFARAAAAAEQTPAPEQAPAPEVTEYDNEAWNGGNPSNLPPVGSPIPVSPALSRELAFWLETGQDSGLDKGYTLTPNGKKMVVHDKQKALDTLDNLHNVYEDADRAAEPGAPALKAAIRARMKMVRALPDAAPQAATPDAPAPDAPEVRHGAFGKADPDSLNVGDRVSGTLASTGEPGELTVESVRMDGGRYRITGTRPDGVRDHISIPSGYQVEQIGQRADADELAWERDLPDAPRAEVVNGEPVMDESANLAPGDVIDHAVKGRRGKWRVVSREAGNALFDKFKVVRAGQSDDSNPEIVNIKRDRPVRVVERAPETPEAIADREADEAEASNLSDEDRAMIESLFTPGPTLTPEQAAEQVAGERAEQTSDDADTLEATPAADLDVAAMLDDLRPETLADGTLENPLGLEAPTDVDGNYSPAQLRFLADEGAEVLVNVDGSDEWMPGIFERVRPDGTAVFRWSGTGDTDHGSRYEWPADSIAGIRAPSRLRTLAEEVDPSVLRPGTEVAVMGKSDKGTYRGVLEGLTDDGRAIVRLPDGTVRNGAARGTVRPVLTGFRPGNEPTADEGLLAPTPGVWTPNGEGLVAGVSGEWVAGIQPTDDGAYEWSLIGFDGGLPGTLAGGRTSTPEVAKRDIEDAFYNLGMAGRAFTMLPGADEADRDRRTGEFTDNLRQFNEATDGASDGAAEEVEAPDNIGGAPAQWVQTGAVAPGDVVRVDGDNGNGSATTHTGHALGTPEEVTVGGGAGKPDKGLLVTVGDDSDGLGDRETVLTPESSLTARVERTGDETGDNPQSAYESQILSDNVEGQMPLDRNGLGIFPGSIVVDGDRRGEVLNVWDRDVEVRWAAGEDSERVAHGHLSVHPDMQARPDGWTRQGRQLKGGDMVSDGDNMGVVQSLSGDEAQVLVGDDARTIGVEELQWIGEVADATTDATAAPAYDVPPSIEGPDVRPAKPMMPADLPAGVQAERVNLKPEHRAALEALGLDTDSITPMEVQEAAARVRHDMPITADMAADLAAYIAAISGSDSRAAGSKRQLQRLINRLAATVNRLNGGEGIQTEPPSAVTAVKVSDLTRGDMVALPNPATGEVEVGHIAGMWPVQNGQVFDTVLALPDGRTRRYNLLPDGEAFLLPDLDADLGARDADGDDVVKFVQPQVNGRAIEAGELTVEAAIGDADGATSIEDLTDKVLDGLTSDAADRDQRNSGRRNKADMERAGLEPEHVEQGRRAAEEAADKVTEEVAETIVNTLEDAEPLPGESPAVAADRVRDLLRDADNGIDHAAIVKAAMARHTGQDGYTPETARAVQRDVVDAIRADLFSYADALAQLGDLDSAQALSDAAARLAGRPDEAQVQKAAEAVAQGRPGVASRVAARIRGMFRRTRQAFGRRVAAIYARVSGKGSVKAAVMQARAEFRSPAEVSQVLAEAMADAAAARPDAGEWEPRSFGERVAYWRNQLPGDSSQFGKTDTPTRGYRGLTLARLRSGAPLEAEDTTGLRLDRAADGGPGETAQQHYKALLGLGAAMDDEVQARVRGLAPELGEDPKGTVLDAIRHAQDLDREQRGDLSDDELAELRAKANADAVEKQRAYHTAMATATRETLSQVRPMGAQGAIGLNIDGRSDDAPEVEALQWAEQFVPTDWLARAGTVEAQAGRMGSYADGTITVAPGPDGLVEGSGRYGGSAMHGLAHHLETALPAIGDAAWMHQWAKSSTGPTGARERTGKDALAWLRDIYPAAGFSTEDGAARWAWDLMEREGVDHSEWLAAGFEALFGDTTKDDDLRQWMLGLLAYLARKG